MTNEEKSSALEATVSGRYATVAGILIIAGYLTYGLPDGILIQPLLNAGDPLGAIAEQTTTLTVAALLMAINSAAVVGIGLFLYPAIKQHNETVALGYLGTRIFEAILMVGGIICLLLLVPLSREYVSASAGDSASLQALGRLAVEGNFFAYHLAMIGLALGSVPLCYLLYRTKLVPRWIPVFGLIGYPALLVLMVVDIVVSGVQPMFYALYIPGAIFEVGFAVWLIGYGFDSA